MRLNLACYTVIPLSCAIYSHHSLYGPLLDQREVVTDSQAPFSFPPPLKSFGALSDSSNQDRSFYPGQVVFKLSKHLGANVPLTSHANRRLYFSFSAPNPTLEESQLLKGLLDRYKSQYEKENLINEILDEWHDAINSIHEDLSAAELQIKTKIQHIIENLDPDKFLHKFGTLYQDIINRINENNKWIPEQDLGHYFQGSIKQKKQHDHRLDDFARARLIQQERARKAKPDSDISNPEEFAQSSPLKRAFFDYIVVEGFGKIMRHIQTAATSNILENLQQKRIDGNISLDSSDIASLIESNNEEDLKWLSNLFAKVHVDGLTPPEIYQMLQNLAAAKVKPKKVLRQDVIIDSKLINKWSTKKISSKGDFSRAFGTEEQFTKELMQKFKSGILKLIQSESKPQEIPYDQILSRLARKYGEKLKIEAEANYLKEEIFVSPDSFERAMKVFDLDPETFLSLPIDRKELAKAWVEDELEWDFITPKSPLTNFLDEIKVSEIYPRIFRHGLLKRIEAYDKRLLALYLEPLKTGDERLQGTKYEKMHEEVINKLNNLATPWLKRTESRLKLFKDEDSLTKEKRELQEEVSAYPQEEKQALLKLLQDSINREPPEKTGPYQTKLQFFFQILKSKIKKLLQLFVGE